MLEKIYRFLYWNTNVCQSRYCVDHIAKSTFGRLMKAEVKRGAFHITSQIFVSGMVFTNKAVEIGMDIGLHFFGKNPKTGSEGNSPFCQVNAKRATGSCQLALIDDVWSFYENFLVCSRCNPSIIVHDVSEQFI